MPGGGVEYDLVFCIIFSYPPGFLKLFLYAPTASLKIFIPPILKEIQEKIVHEQIYASLQGRQRVF